MYGLWFFDATKKGGNDNRNNKKILSLRYNLAISYETIVYMNKCDIIKLRLALNNTPKNLRELLFISIFKYPVFIYILIIKKIYINFLILFSI